MNLSLQLQSQYLKCLQGELFILSENKGSCCKLIYFVSLLEAVVLHFIDSLAQRLKSQRVPLTLFEN